MKDEILKDPYADNSEDRRQRAIDLMLHMSKNGEQEGMTVDQIEQILIEVWE